MTSEEIRTKFLAFFEERGHKVIPSASLVPENDPSVLFTTAGMHPLVPYLLGEKHPLGKRLCNVQKCLRTDDIEEVGDAQHLTFFEMLGYWSLGDYFKKESIHFTFDFFTQVLGFNKDDISITVFKGDETAPFDQESYDTWKDEIGIPEERIYKYGRKENWWGPVGETGPCGPCTEMFIDTGLEKCSKDCGPSCHCDKFVEIGNNVFMEFNRSVRIILVDGMYCLYDENFKINSKLLEVINSFKTQKIVVVKGHHNDAQKLLSQYGIEVFSLEEDGIGKDNPIYFKKLMEKYHLDISELIYFDHKEESVACAKKLGIISILYENDDQTKEFIDNNIAKFEPLDQKNVDVGLGLERLAMFSQNKKSIFEIDLFEPIIKKIEELSGKKYAENEKEFRIIADHIRAAVFAIADGVVPSNKESGYVVRRMIRRAIVSANNIGIKTDFTPQIADQVASIYQPINHQIDNIKKVLGEEEEKFRQTLKRALDRLSELSGKEISGKDLFDLYQSFGMPLEVSIEEIKRADHSVSNKAIEQFNNELKNHQDLSRTASAGMFKGGLADNKAETTRLHTAAHLLLAALRQVLGPQVEQKGANITEERLRFDFNNPEKLTDEQIKEVEKIVNEKIESSSPVEMTEMSLDEAKKCGATGSFSDKYGDRVKVYTIGSGAGPSTREARSGSREFFSREICGGPHVKNTNELGHFKIVKEESSSAGIRRIKAVLE